MSPAFTHRRPPRDTVLWWAGLVLYAALLLLLSPAAVNGDGVGYLRRVGQAGVAPGHPGYLPLLRLLAGLWPQATPWDLVLPARLLSVSCAMGALWLHRAACLTLFRDVKAATRATLLLGVTHAFIRSATEVEAYGPALLCTMVTLWVLARWRRREQPPALGWAVAAGLSAALATQLHLTLALLALPVALVSTSVGNPRQRAVRLLLAGGSMALACGAALLLWLRLQGIHDVAAALSWLMSSSHGIPDPHGWSAPLMATWGVLRSVAYAPYLYQGSIAASVLLTCAAAALCVPLVRCIWAGRSRVYGRLLWSWSLPLALFAMLFFPSDTERWLFVLPAITCCAAPALVEGTRRRWSVLLAALLAINLLLGQVPRALDSAPVILARAATRSIPASALVVSPGHGWDELLGLHVQRSPELYPLAFYAGALGGLQPALAEMQRRIQARLAAGRRVFVARLHEGRDPRGFKELRWMGLKRGGLRASLQRYQLVHTPVSELWELHRRPATR